MANTDSATKYRNAYKYIKSSDETSLSGIFASFLSNQAVQMSDFLPKSLCSFYYYFFSFFKESPGSLIRHSKIVKAGDITNDESRIQNENRAN